MIAKVAVFLPAATVTDGGMVASDVLDVRVITAPPAAAGLRSVTVPTAGFPPMTEVGAIVTARGGTTLTATGAEGMPLVTT